MPLPSAAGEKAWAILTPEQQKKLDEAMRAVWVVNGSAPPTTLQLSADYFNMAA